jgi:ABC-2 type transport system permease protein
MVGHLVRLKLRLTRNRLRRSGPLAVVGFILLWFGALGLGAMIGLGAFAAVRAFGPPALLLAWVVIAAAWLVGPLVAAALDETLEPRRLELLPLPPLRLVTGLLAAAAIGPGALATAVVVCLSLLGMRIRGPAWPLALVAAFILLGWCLASSRLVTTVLSDLLRTRRGRDVATLVVALFGGLGAFMSQVFRSLNVGRLPSAQPFLAVLDFTPPGALAKAVGQASREGDIVWALLFLIYGLAATLLVLWAWSRSLQRLSTRAPVAGAVRRSAEGSVFIPRTLRWFRVSPTIAAAAKELKGIRRDPRMRSQFIGVGVAMLALLLGSSQFVFGTEYAPLVAVVGGWVGVSGTGFNQFGMDDRTFWAYVCSGVNLRKVLAGKNLALVMLGVPVALILGVLGGVVGGTFRTLPTALLAAFAVMAVWLAVGSNTSVLGPFPLPESNMFGSRNLPGSAFTASIGGILVAGALTLPVALMVGLPWLLFGELAAFAGAVAAFAYGVIIYRVGLGVAGDQLDSRSLRLLEVLDKESR